MVDRLRNVCWRYRQPEEGCDLEGLRSVYAASKKPNAVAFTGIQGTDHRVER
ncbi:MAG TPA: hypothetical protein VEL28_23055 [Candidatus Binatia bacterium]|nr:hypothetical protein [Candidatus Binatia bacterium]